MGYQAPDLKIAKLWVTGLLDLVGGARVKLRFQTKTADYTVLAADTGTIFTNYGDVNAINYTLPTNPEKGLCYVFVSAVDQNMTVTGTTDLLVAHDDATATSCAFSTGSNKIGQCLFVFADGNIWYCIQVSAGTLSVT